jgi:hypothetical protein
LVLLIASKTLPAGVALILAREADQTIVAVSSDLSADQLLAAEVIAFARADQARVVMVSELTPMA